jgi:nitrogen fixation protein NifU and related proteins
MSDLRTLYQEVIVDHNRSPRNFRALENATHVANGHNALCGDKLRVFLHVENEVIQQATFVGAGCAISMASASLMTEALKGKTIADAESLFDKMHEMLTVAGCDHDVGKLTVLSGVHEYPARVKCATLAWHTLDAALHHTHESVRTE